MPLAINSNANSLSAQRQMSGSALALSTALQRLSSGLRINGARDDAAGLAIAERFTTQIKGTDQAARNTNDAISLAQTAEGALGSISNNLQRMRELAIQAANSTNSASDRAALQAEAAQLITENDRIASQTEFNGSKLLDGSFNGQQFQVGANRAQTVAMGGFGSMRSDSLGTYNGIDTFVLASPTNGAPSNLTITLNGPGTVFNLGNVATDGNAIRAAINAAGVQGLTAQAGGHGFGAGISSTGAVNGTAVVTINGVNINVNYVAGSGATLQRANDAAAAINAQSAATGVFAEVQSNGSMFVGSVDDRNITLSYSAGTATGSVAHDYGFLAGTYTSYPDVSYQGPPGSAVTSVTINGAGMGSVTASVTPLGTALSKLDISTTAGANLAVDAIDTALNTVNAVRATMGALQNRFQSAIANLQTSSENMSAARGRIQDADFALETANLSRAQILQQASTAMVAQANQSPQGVLALLK